MEAAGPTLGHDLHATLAAASRGRAGSLQLCCSPTGRGGEPSRWVWWRSQPSRATIHRLLPVCGKGPTLTPHVALWPLERNQVFDVSIPFLQTPGCHGNALAVGGCEGTVSQRGASISPASSVSPLLAVVYRHKDGKTHIFHTI